MGGELFPIHGGGKSGDQALQDHGRLSGAGDSGDYREFAFGDADIQRMHRVDRAGLHTDGPL